MAKDFATDFYNSRRWHVCRQIVIDRANGLCERCSERGVKRYGVIVHHTTVLTPENINDADVTLNVDRLQYVCKDCHEELHSIIDNGLPQRDCVVFSDDGQPKSR